MQNAHTHIYLCTLCKFHYLSYMLTEEFHRAYRIYINMKFQFQHMQDLSKHSSLVWLLCHATMNTNFASFYLYFQLNIAILYQNILLKYCNISQHHFVHSTQYLPTFGTARAYTPSIDAITGSLYRFFHGIFRVSFPVKETNNYDTNDCLANIAHQ